MKKLTIVKWINITEDTLIEPGGIVTKDDILSTQQKIEEFTKRIDGRRAVLFTIDYKDIWVEAAIELQREIKKLQAQKILVLFFAHSAKGFSWGSLRLADRSYTAVDAQIELGPPLGEILFKEKGSVLKPFPFEDKDVKDVSESYEVTWDMWNREIAAGLKSVSPDEEKEKRFRSHEDIVLTLAEERKKLTPARLFEFGISNGIFPDAKILLDVTLGVDGYIIDTEKTRQESVELHNHAS